MHKYNNATNNPAPPAPEYEISMHSTANIYIIIIIISSSSSSSGSSSSMMFNDG